MLPAALNFSATGSASSFALRSDLARATRGMIAFLGPLLFAQTQPHAAAELAFAAIAAQNIAFFEVRGDYRLRLAVLGCALLILAGAAALGAATSTPLVLALIATAAAAASTGIWRHLNPDYGPPLAISSMLVFLIAQETARGFSPTHILHTGLWTLGGGLWGIVVQIVPWFFRPQQPLRAALAECWTAAADFFDAGSAEKKPHARHALVMEKEAALRNALDKSYGALTSARTRRAHAVIDRLEHTAHAAARLTMRVGALQTALETVPPRADGPALQPAFQPILVSLANHARTVALAVVSRQPSHLALVDVRQRRLLNLFEAFEAGLDPHAPVEAHLLSLCALVRESLRETEASLRSTINRAAERAAFSLELTDTDTWSLRPLGAALNVSRRFDPVLVRFTGRLVFLTSVATAAAHAFALPHGYWLPFTVLVVLQPDYGSTRAKAAQRVAGTLFGSLLAIGLLWLALPANVLFALMTVSLFAFGFFMKRDYSVGVLFVTIFVVLLTGLHQPVTASLAWERLAANALGGVLALGGALVFWPVWERRRFPPILAASLRANLNYWEQIDQRLREGRAFDADLIKAKQRVETANASVFASLKRLTADPKNRQIGLEHTAALANGNQRLTRAFSVIALQLTTGTRCSSPTHARFSAQIVRALTTLADAVEGRSETPDSLRACRRELTAPAGTSVSASAFPDASAATSPAPDPTPNHALDNLRASMGTELAALLLAAESCQSLGLFEPSDPTA